MIMGRVSASSVRLQESRGQCEKRFPAPRLHRTRKITRLRTTIAKHRPRKIIVKWKKPVKIRVHRLKNLLGRCCPWPMLRPSCIHTFLLTRNITRLIISVYIWCPRSPVFQLVQRGSAEPYIYSYSVGREELSRAIYRYTFKP